jgi:hypothetical protein
MVANHLRNDVNGLMFFVDNDTYGGMKYNATHFVPFLLVSWSTNEDGATTLFSLDESRNKGATTAFFTVGDDVACMFWPWLNTWHGSS